VAETAKDDADQAVFPTMASLFGSNRFLPSASTASQCSARRPTWSTFLQLLDREELDWQGFPLDDWRARHGGAGYEARYQKPYDALLMRRPDLANLALTCENTLTAMALHRIS
jgi:hypothetical protein